MSDMSTPPLHLATPGLADPRAALSPPAPPRFAWPTPRDAGYAVAVPLAEAEPAELEGPNGTVTMCRLLAIHPAEGTVHVQTSSSRGGLKLKLTQFRRLTLLRPLKPMPRLGGGLDAPPRKLHRGSLQLLRITFRDKHLSEVKSLSHIALPIGHFVFSPLNSDGDLLRSFYPQPMVLSVDASELAPRRPAPPTMPAPLTVPGGLAAAPKVQPPAPAPAPATAPAEIGMAGLTLPAATGPNAPPTSTTDPARSARLQQAALPDLADSGFNASALAGLQLAPLDSEVAAAAATPATAGPKPPAAADPTAALALSPGPATRTGTQGPPPGLALLPELTEVVAMHEVPGLADATNASGRTVSDILHTQQISTPTQLLAAIEQQAKMPMVRIGEALMALGYISEQKLGDALQAQSRDRSLPLGELLVRRGDVTRIDLQTALARKMGYPVVDVMAFPVEPEAAQRLQLSVARRLPALPLMQHGGRLVVALEDPSARNVIDEIEFSAQCKVVPVLARAGTLIGGIENVYLRMGKDTIEPTDELRLSFHADGEDSADKLLANLESDTRDLADDGPVIEQSDNSLVRLINTMILEARQQGVSDIHIESPPAPQKVQVRFRKDGVLRPYIELPQGYRQAIVARIKIMCDLDISERRKPQDGKINFSRFMQGTKLELRVATIPTANGLEDVVMRLLSSAKALPLDGMGLQPDVLDKLRSAVERPYGLVLCVGPTGSGKTTTLHAALGHINTPQRKIWTAEDPVEITQAGLRQVQVNPKIDWTFAKALRAFLRADPDVVMVGEIRDEETAQMAIEASLTGHLVLSTLHTNSAPETVTRLLDMGMDPFSFADSLLGVLAQRLVRRWCKHCVTRTAMEADRQETLLSEFVHAYNGAENPPDPDVLRGEWLARYGQQGVLVHHHAPGCNHCGGSGFSGRVGLHELLVVSREMRHLVQTRAPALTIQRQAMSDGMRTLRQDGILKVLAGLTSIEEVRAISNL